MASAALYYRSSKDRAEMGLTAQRAELKAFAESKGLSIASDAEYADMEISGSLDETSRPGLRKLLRDLSDPARKWGTILTVDTSRIARDPMLALYVTREAEKRGVTIQYAKVPIDGSSAFGETMLSVLRAFDRLHARLSAEKGRGGLVANLSEGFRAGGAAPFGYKLKHEETGAKRAGIAVRKSKLVVDAAAAAKVKTFLQARADGVSRPEAAKRAGMQKKQVASLIAIERNALTYAGYGVWNMRQKVKPTREDQRKTMRWRPRSEWQISEKPTHEALITRAQAERILATHSVLSGETRAKTARAAKPGEFILSGLLFSPEGAQWVGDTDETYKAYRVGKGRRISAPWIEGEILYQLMADFHDPSFLGKTIAEARRLAAGIETDPSALDAAIRRAEGRLQNLLNLGADEGDKAVLAKIRELQAEIDRLRADKAAWAERAQLKAKLESLTEQDLRNALLASAVRRLGHDLERDWGWADLHKLEQLRPEALRHVLTTLVERIELETEVDPKTQKRGFTIRYRLPIGTGARMASPRGLKPGPGPTLVVSSQGGLGSPRDLRKLGGRPPNTQIRRPPEVTIGGIFPSPRSSLVQRAGGHALPANAGQQRRLKCN